MQDIAPEILKRIQSDFKEKCRNDKELGKLIDKIDSGKGDFRDAQGFAEHIGDRLGEAYVENLTEETLPNGRLYRNIAEKVIAPTLEHNHELVCDASGKVEQALNEEAGIGLKVQVPELDQDRLNGLIDHVSDHEEPFTTEKAQELADLAENFTHHVVDAFIEKNADAHYAAGLSPKIERDAMAECCAWCLDLAGTYDYPLKDRSVYQRHKDCRCVVDYHPGNGKVQNVHSKEWRDETDSDILEARKTIGLEPLVDPAKVEQRKQKDKNEARIIDLVKEVNRGNAKYSVDTVLSGVGNSSVGRESIEYIENNNIKVFFDDISYGNGARGGSDYGYIRLYTRHIQSEIVAEQTLIHEAAHLRFNIGGCQHAEAICYAFEKMHLENRTYITKAEWEILINKAKEVYDDYSWEDGGYGDFGQFDFIRG